MVILHLSRIARRGGWCSQLDFSGPSILGNSKLAAKYELEVAKALYYSLAAKE